LVAPFVWGFLFALWVGFFADLEAVVLLAVRLTGADATEAAGMMKDVMCGFELNLLHLSASSSNKYSKAARVHYSNVRQGRQL
jgi:hypothetical protein